MTDVIKTLRTAPSTAPDPATMNNKVKELFNSEAALNRRYNLGGCFTLIGVVAAKADRPDPHAPISLAYSWLPLSMQRLPKNDWTAYRCPGVIPALSDRTFRRVAPAIDAYASARGYVVQPATYFYHPPGLVELLGEEGKIKDLASVSREQPTSERLLIDTTSQTENNTVMADLIDICVKVLEHAGIAEPAYMQGNTHPRAVINELLSDLPFLVHHIFKALPALVMLRHRGRINGRDDVVHHVRYESKGVMDMDINRLMRPNLINVVP